MSNQSYLLKKTLTKLRNAGKKLFLTSDAHEQYTHRVMVRTLGPEWINHFDLAVARCRKPIWFNS